MAGGNSRQRRRFNRAVAKAVTQKGQSGMPVLPPEPNPVPPARRGRLNVGDSIGFISLLLAVIFVIITPPFWIKVPLLALCACGFFVFTRRSQWTADWHRLLQFGTGSIAIAILALIAIPQLRTQWRSEHPGVVSPPVPNHLYDLSGDRRTKFEDSIKRQTEPKPIIRVGCTDWSEQSCVAAGRFLLAISEAGWEIDSKRVFRMQQLIPKDGVSIAANDPKGANYKDLPPHMGFWHKMSATEVTFYYAFQGINIPVNSASDASLPDGTIGVYFGPEPQK